mmetsp:Transcript_20588/g.32779  ORF Transcript_20588/g.32779 Transcript_20588/m.32779 type:complete len:421 (-) Transcript_20588:182-1444(-)
MLALVAVGLGVVYGASRTFVPQEPQGTDFHKERVWAWLNPKCFATEADVRNFKDYLLSQYQCLDFNEKREKIYQRPNIDGLSSVWSLWLELNHAASNFDCLTANISLPSDIAAECIANIFYEPLEHTQVCKDQSRSIIGGDLWNLDLLDGNENNLYQFWDYGNDQAVEAIILDTDVDAFHTEFVGLNIVNLFNGDMDPRTSQNHGTHVAGTVSGHIVGGAKETDFSYYPVCQLGSSCAWSDIEGGYEAAISLMLSNPNVRYVINFSVGGSRNSLNDPAYTNWGRRINDAGGFWVTSAGNSASNACNFAPAFSDWAISVGSYSENKQPTTWFTNFGSCVNTFGPGESVYSALPGDAYGYASGTSMASPATASIVVNVLKQSHNMDLDGILSYMKENSFPLLNVPSGWLGDNTAATWPRCSD